VLFSKPQSETRFDGGTTVKDVPPLMPPYAAVIVVTPLLRPLANPVASIEAAAGLLLVQAGVTTLDDPSL
jgi:hypothetical protein